MENEIKLKTDSIKNIHIISTSLKTECKPKTLTEYKTSARSRAPIFRYGVYSSINNLLQNCNFITTMRGALQATA